MRRGEVVEVVEVDPLTVPAPSAPSRDDPGADPSQAPAPAEERPRVHA